MQLKLWMIEYRIIKKTFRLLPEPFVFIFSSGRNEDRYTLYTSHLEGKRMLSRIKKRIKKVEKRNSNGVVRILIK